MNCNDTGLNHSVLCLKNVFAMLKSRCIIDRDTTDGRFSIDLSCVKNLETTKNKQTKQNTTNGDQLWVNNNFYW